jgi:hypothetical protein
MAEPAEFNLSDLVRNPTPVIHAAETGDVIIHRRGKADLRLALASRAQTRSAVSEDLARLVATLAADRAGRAVLVRRMPGIYPWMRFLPRAALESCITDLLEVAEACASMGNFAAYDTELSAWRDTAEIYSDPELQRRLRGPVRIDSRLGPVVRPEGR